MRRRDVQRAHYSTVARLGILTVEICLSGCIALGPRAPLALAVVHVRGTAFDSLTRAPLADTRIVFQAADSGGDTVTSTTTDTKGAFALSLRSGTWLAAIEYPQLDSLRVSLPPRRIEVPPRETFTVALATASPNTVTQTLCGTHARNDDVAVVGMVRNAATHNAVDSARVLIKWVDLTVRAGGIVRSTSTRVTRTNRDGWYVSCNVPAEAALLSWAERGGATTGAVPFTAPREPARLDFILDTAAHASKGSSELEPDSSGASLFPTSTGSTRYRVVVRDLQSRPVTNARVRILGRSDARSDSAGAVTFDSLSSGTQTLEVLSIGYQPQRRVINVAPGGDSADTVVLASARSVLDTIRITSGRDPTGFELRRSTRVGQFISAEDVVRENPARTTQLLRKRKLLNYTFDRNGFAQIDVDHACPPLILVDGFPPYMDGVPKIPGEAALDWLVHPDEIGGVEIYTSVAQIPPEIARLSFGPPPCAVIVFWTREALRLPKPKSTSP